MTCPDCGGNLVEITLTGIDKINRCFKCGGVWIKSNTLDELPVQALKSWKLNAGIESESLIGGTGICPEDGSQLDGVESKNIPQDWNVRKCTLCKSYWWPLDTLFRVGNVSELGKYLRVGQVFEI